MFRHSYTYKGRGTMHKHDREQNAQGHAGAFSPAASSQGSIQWLSVPHGLPAAHISSGPGTTKCCLCDILSTLS
jgi:hypothetical protein